MKQTILVTGATGKQGGAVARHLLDSGHTVRAVTRKADSSAAKALAARGAELVVADLADRDAMTRAAAGANAVFSMTTPFEAGMAAETLQGITVANAAKAAGAFLVFTSVGSADRATGIPHFDSKYAVEQHIRAENIEATIIAPAYFMENVGFVQKQLREGVYPSPLTPARSLAQVAVADIAAVAVTVLENRTRYTGKRYDLAGDELSGLDSMKILSQVTGRSFNYFQMPLEMVRGAMGEDMALMYEWFEKVGYTIDRQALAREFPDVRWTTFETWARTFDWGAFLGS